MLLLIPYPVWFQIQDTLDEARAEKSRAKLLMQQFLFFQLHSLDIFCCSTIISKGVQPTRHVKELRFAHKLHGRERKIN